MTEAHDDPLRHWRATGIDPAPALFLEKIDSGTLQVRNTSGAVLFTGDGAALKAWLAYVFTGGGALNKWIAYVRFTQILRYFSIDLEKGTKLIGEAIAPGEWIKPARLAAIKQLLIMETVWVAGAALCAMFLFMTVMTWLMLFIGLFIALPAILINGALAMFGLPPLVH